MQRSLRRGRTRAQRRFLAHYGHLYEQVTARGRDLVCVRRDGYMTVVDKRGEVILWDDGTGAKRRERPLHDRLRILRGERAA